MLGLRVLGIEGFQVLSFLAGTLQVRPGCCCSEQICQLIDLCTGALDKHFLACLPQHAHHKRSPSNLSPPPPPPLCLGRVPVRVRGPVKAGDVLVPSGLHGAGLNTTLHYSTLRASAHSVHVQTLPTPILALGARTLLYKIHPLHTRIRASIYANSAFCKFSLLS